MARSSETLEAVRVENVEDASGERLRVRLACVIGVLLSSFIFFFSLFFWSLCN